MTPTPELPEGTTAEPGSDPAAPPSPPATGNPDASGAVSADELRRRDLQSQLDRAKSEIASLKGAAAAQPAPSAPAQGFDASQVASLVSQELQRVDGLRSATADLKTKYPNARFDLVGDVTKFESAVALEAAVAASHERETGRVTEIETAAEARIRAQYEAAFGRLPGPPPATGTAPGTTKFTPEQVTRMTIAELDAAGITDADLARLASTGKLD